MVAEMDPADDGNNDSTVLATTPHLIRHCKMVRILEFHQKDSMQTLGNEEPKEKHLSTHSLSRHSAKMPKRVS